MQHPFNCSRTILLLAFICMGLSVYAQKQNGYESISTAQGLSQGMIFDLLQDQEGFIWIATKNGLNRYDGYGFKVFTNDPYSVNSLSSNTIMKLLEDSKGRIWIGTEDAGINIYDKKSGRFHRIQHDPENAAGLSGNAIRCMAELPDGRMLVASFNGGFTMIELPNGFFEKSALPIKTSRFKLPTNSDVYAMGKDMNGTMWIGGFDGTVYQFDPAGKSLVPKNHYHLLNDGYVTKNGDALINSNYFLSDGNNILPLFDTTKIKAGNLLFRHNQILWRNHYRDLISYDISKRENGQPLKWDIRFPDSIKTLFPFLIDRSGIVWSGSMGYGLRKYNTTGSRFNHNLLVGYSVRWIKAGKANEIFTSDYGYNLRKINDQGIDKNPFIKFPQLSQVDYFLISRTGHFWLKSEVEGFKGYYEYDPVTGILKKHFSYRNETSGDKQPMLEDSKGYIWYAARGGLFRRVHATTGKMDSLSIVAGNIKQVSPNTICTALYEDGQGVYWIGTQEGFAKVSLNNNNTASPQIQWFYNNTGNRNSLNYNHVSSFLDDPSEPTKYLWICTKGGGLNRLNKITGDFFHLTTKQGLTDDVVYGILSDKAGNLWGSTNNGLFCLLQLKRNDTTHLNIRKFTKANGLQDDEFNTGAYESLPNGDLAFGGVNGLNVFTPEKVLAEGFMPNVFITDILINNEPIVAGDNTGVLENTIEHAKHITLSHLQDIITLEFSSLDFTAPEQNKYRYQLTGVDKNWVESGTRRSATYLHLPSGKYTFKVQGSNSQGIWSNNIAELSITILPPWWLSWWAFIVYALLVVFGAWALFRFFINREKLKAQLNVEQLEAKRVKELDAVKTELYTNITHEFRTPLTVILGMARQVKDNPSVHLNAGIDMIVRNGQSLLKLVNEMLDLSKLETGKMDLQLINGDIINFLRYIVESFHSLAESQGKQMHFLTDVDMLHTKYDPEKLRQVMANLLSNAIKFTPEKGNIYISVADQEIPENDGKVVLVIKVKDTGIGIPEIHLQQIFDRFYRLDNSHNRKTEGTGIGLALTKELVKLMSGDISAKSPPAGSQKGTEFTITLPLSKITDVEEHAGIPALMSQDQHTGALPETETDTSPDHKKRPLILLVEDNADVVAYTASCLPDYRLAVGKDGQEGFDIAIELIPDLIITDVMMPLVDGFELCRRLRKDERTCHIPIIMLTAKAGLESKIEGLQHGADAYLEKPFNREELLIRMSKMLEMRQSLQQYYLKKAGLGQVVEKSAASEETIAITLVEDGFVAKVREAVETHLNDTDFTVEQLCKKVFMSHSQLHRKLDALTGYSPNKFIRMIRLNKAKELMKNPSNSITQVAYECGYNDPGYFARVFKQEFGETPQEWRSKN